MARRSTASIRPNLASQSFSRLLSLRGRLPSACILVENVPGRPRLRLAFTGSSSYPEYKRQPDVSGVLLSVDLQYFALCDDSLSLNTFNHKLKTLHTTNVIRRRCDVSMILTARYCQTPSAYPQRSDLGNIYGIVRHFQNFNSQSLDNFC